MPFFYLFFLPTVFAGVNIPRRLIVEVLILRFPWPRTTALWHIQPERPWNSMEKNRRFLTEHLQPRRSKTGLKNLTGQLCMIQGFALNAFPGKVLYCIVCWFVGHSSGGCYSNCLHFLSVAAHIKDFVLVSIIVTNWILHFPRTHVINLEHGESLCARMWVCVSKRTILGKLSWEKMKHKYIWMWVSLIWSKHPK